MTSSVSCRPLCRSRTISRTPRIAPERPARTGQQAVRLEQCLDVALEADAAVGEQDDVVADALDVGDTCDAITTVAPRLRDAVHQQLQELAAGERVEARERLVEQKQRRPLAEHEREREARALAFRQRADLRALGRSREQARPPTAPSQRGFVRRANSIVSATLNER